MNTRIDIKQIGNVSFAKQQPGKGRQKMLATRIHSFFAICVRLNIYRVTHQVGPKLSLTSKQKLHFSIKILYRNATFVLMSMGGLVIPDVSPCKMVMVW